MQIINLCSQRRLIRFIFSASILLSLAQSQSNTVEEVTISPETNPDNTDTSGSTDNSELPIEEETNEVTPIFLDYSCTIASLTTVSEQSSSEEQQIIAKTSQI